MALSGDGAAAGDGLGSCHYIVSAVTRCVIVIIPLYVNDGSLAIFAALKSLYIKIVNQLIPFVF